MPNALVIHHNDNDGFCAAWLAKRYFDQFETPVEFFETNYGQEPPDVTDKDVYILDFSYPRETLEAIKAAARSILVIDHHKTAQTALEGLDYCIFDMEHSGCQLTRKHFGLPGHWLVDYVEDRDLWQWRLDWSREVNAALSSYPKSFDVWDALASRQFPDDLMKEGIVILRYQERLVERACLCAEEVELDGHRIPIVNATNLQSEIGSKLCEGKPFAATFSASIDGSLTYSLRSDENGLDVSEIAKKLGGGGHRRAAGFKATRPEVGK